MNKSLFFAGLLAFSAQTLAATDHFILRDGNHVQHLKISRVNDDINVSADVDFEPNASETGKHACSAEVSGEAKQTSATELVMKKRIEGEARSCSIKIQLTNNGAILEQSDDCHYYAAGICHFSSDGKELLKIK